MTASRGHTKTHLRRGHVWAVGDIHGALPRLRELLLQASIVDEDDKWSAGAVTGVCVGDYLNRGEDGAGVVVWLRQLQQEARAAGGDVIALVGNHDVLMCGVLTERQHMPYGEFAGRWLLNGGRFLDLERLEQVPSAVEWLHSLPAMALVGDTLYLHSDTIGYAELGASVEEVNDAVQSILRSGDLDRIASLFDLLCRRGELSDAANVEALLERFGGSRIVHGHSPIFADRPAVSHGGRSVNIEGMLWESDEDERLGFIYWPEDDATL